MIEIIPNWHPLFVHFTVGLLTTSVLFFLASAVLSHTNSWKQQWLNMANWSLWSGCLFAIATAIAGWLAYNSVTHDSASHAAMTLHRNWALPTAATFLLLGLWAILIARKGGRPGFLFLIFSIIAVGLLVVTGWLGSEAVYRYGLGVKSLPVVTEGADGHNHSHGSDHDDLASDETGHQHEHESQTLVPEQLLEATPHSHEHKKTLHEIEHLLKLDGAEHGLKSKSTGSKIKQANELTADKPQTATDNKAEITVQPSATKSHAHDLKRIEAMTTPLDQENISDEITSTTPPEGYPLDPAEGEGQDAETHDHHHEH